METEIINNGTQVLTHGTQILGSVSSLDTTSFTGGFLQLGENVSGWTVKEKINVQSGEADLYAAEKNGEKGVIKFYRGTIHPKKDLMDKLLGLSHPDIIKLYEVGQYKNHFFEIMEFAAGGALDTRNDDGSYKYLPMEEDEVLQVCKEVVNSFKTCHERGIIHRDIKPANIYYRNEDGSDVVIADFGISSIINEDEVMSHKTMTASRTTGYAAPEVLSGIISPKMDYYALGITLWELSTGQDPFLLPSGKRRNDAHLIRDTIEGRIADDLLSREPALSERMQSLIRGLLVIDSQKRWGYDEVTRFLNGENVPVPSKIEKLLEYDVEGEICTSLESIGKAMSKNINSDKVKKELYRGFLSGYLEDYYPDVARKIDEITEKYPADDKNNRGLQLVAWLLDPSIPYISKSGYVASNLDELSALVTNAPEEMLPTIEDGESNFYLFLSHIGRDDMATKIKEIKHDSSSDVNRILGLYQSAVIMSDNKISPFSGKKHSNFTLYEVGQLRNVSPFMKDYILGLIKERSSEGLMLPWLLQNGLDFEKIGQINTWNDLAFDLGIFEDSDVQLTDDDKTLLKNLKDKFYNDGVVNPVYEELNKQRERLAYNREFEEIYGPVHFAAMKGKNPSEDDEKLYPLCTAEWIIRKNANNKKFAESEDAKKVNDIFESYKIKYGSSVVLKCLKVMYDLLLVEDMSKYELEDLGEPHDRLELSWQVRTFAKVQTLKGGKILEFSKSFCEENNLYWSFMNETL